MPVFAPQPGPQTLFASTPADIAILGGSAFGGKSWSLSHDVCRYLHVPGFSATYFRRTSPELTGSGSLWEYASEMLPHFGGVPTESPQLRFRFPNRNLVQFQHLQYLKTIYAHQSKSYCGLYFDELTHFLERQFWYLQSRNRSICGIRPYTRGSTNPDPDSFVRGLIDWWIGEDGYAIAERSGAIRWLFRDKVTDEVILGDYHELAEKYPSEKDDLLSLTFIRASLEDNPIGTTRDPGYIKRLRSLPKIERLRLEGGNWNIRASAGLFFQEDYFRVIEDPPRPEEIVSMVRWWDRAATEVNPNNPDPDYTAHVKLARTYDDRTVILDAGHFRGSPATVDATQKRYAVHDGTNCTVGVFQDPGSAGKNEIAHITRQLEGWPLAVRPARENKQLMAGPASAAAEHGYVDIVRGDWNAALFREAEDFPDGAHDDMVDCLSAGYTHLKHGSSGQVDVNPEAFDLPEDEPAYI